MTKVDYRLEDGRVVVSYVEAMASGQKFETRFHENFQEEKSESEIAWAEARKAKLAEKYPSLA